MSHSDVIIKHYKTGNLIGKIAMFFTTDKAKKVFEKLQPNNTNYILAFKEEQLLKANEKQINF